MRSSANALRPTRPSPLSGRAAAPLTVIQLKGSQEEMGEQHGKLLRQLGGWEQAVDFYPTMVHHLLTEGGTGPSA